MTEVLSPIFGQLGLVHVEDGAVVAEGDELGEIEAMKMYTRFFAPTSGTLTWVVELGEIVGEGDVVAEINP